MSVIPGKFTTNPEANLQSRSNEYSEHYPSVYSVMQKIYNTITGFFFYFMVESFLL